MKLLLLSLILLRYTLVFSSFTCVPLEIMNNNNNPISNTPIGKIFLNDSGINCQLYLRKFNTSKELYETSLIDPWVDRYKHLFYKHLKLSYPNYDTPIYNTSQFKVFVILDSIHRIKPLRIGPEDINRILQQTNCTFYDDVDVHFHEDYISHRPEHRLK